MLYIIILLLLLLHRVALFVVVVAVALEVNSLKVIAADSAHFQVHVKGSSCWFLCFRRLFLCFLYFASLLRRRLRFRLSGRAAYCSGA